MMIIDLYSKLEQFFTVNKLVIENFRQCLESQEYDACTFELNYKKIVFRSAKITPTKIGLFVTLWKRSTQGPIAPFDLNDDVDFFIINVQTLQHSGHFIFPKNILYQQGYISKNNIAGKRAMRIYPPWVKTHSPQAQKTQKWQLPFFIEIQEQHYRSSSYYPTFIC